MAETDALSGAKFSSGLWLKDFPCKIRVLTRDPMVYNDQFGNTRYAFAIYNLDLGQLQILNKGPGFAQRFQEINSDPDFGGDVRKVDLKITTNGKQGKEIRYTITPMGTPGDLPAQIVKDIVANGFDLAEKIQKNNPNAMRLSEVNAGAELPPAEEDETPTPTSEPKADDVVIEDIGDEPINLDDIPF